MDRVSNAGGGASQPGRILGEAGRPAVARSTQSTLPGTVENLSSNVLSKAGNNVCENVGEATKNIKPKVIPKPAGPSVRNTSLDNLVLNVSAQQVIRQINAGTHGAAEVVVTDSEGKVATFIRKHTENDKSTAAELFTANMQARLGLGANAKIHAEGGEQFIYSQLVPNSVTLDEALPFATKEGEFLEYDVTPDGTVTVTDPDTGEASNTEVKITDNTITSLFANVGFKLMIGDSDLKLSNLVIDDKGHVSGIDTGLAFQQTPSDSDRLLGALTSFLELAQSANIDDEKAVNRANSSMAMLLNDASSDVTLPFTKFIIEGNKVNLLATEIRNTVVGFVGGESASYAGYVQAQSTTTHALEKMKIDSSDFQRESNEGGAYYDTATAVPERLLQIVTQYAAY